MGPLKFRWKVELDILGGKRTVYHEAAVPASLEGPLLELIALTKSLLEEG